jgi:hypothetical protein
MQKSLFYFHVAFFHSFIPNIEVCYVNSESRYCRELHACSSQEHWFHLEDRGDLGGPPWYLRS